jgi:hydroxypyruvate reductase
MEIDGWPGLVVFSGGTDGNDGPTDAAGAVADGETVARAREMGLSAGEYLRENDSYSFFERLGDLVKTGPTGTNVMDVALIMVG